MIVYHNHFNAALLFAQIIVNSLNPVMLWLLFLTFQKRENHHFHPKSLFPVQPARWLNAWHNIALLL